MKKLLATFVILLGTFAQAQQPWTNILNPLDSSFPGSTTTPTAYGIDWSRTNVGIPGGIPARTTICTTLSSTGADQSAAITSALSACPSGQTVLLNPGTFLINSHVTVPANVTLRGSGASQTILNCKGSGSGCGIAGSGNVGYTGVLNITAGATAGSTSITLSGTAGVTVGGYLAISEINNPVWVTSTGTEGPCNWCDGSWTANGSRARGQIVEVETIVGNVVTISPALYGSYTQTPTVVPFTAATKNAGFENLQFFMNNTGYTNNIYFSKCAYCWTKGVEYNYSDGNPIEVDWGYRDEIRDGYITNAYTHQPGSTDSAIFLVLKTSASLVENNILERQHVGIILNWGAAGNVVSYNYSQGNFDASATNVLMSGYLHHGAHPQFNLWEGNVGEQLYLDSVWGSSSHDTDFRGWYLGTSNICTPFATGGRATVTTPCHLAVQAARAVQASELTHYDNYVGDVVGSTQANSISSTRTTFLVSPTSRAYDGAVYGFTFGYGEASDSSGNCSSTATCTPKTSSLLHGIFSDYDGTTTWSGSITHTLPPSFYLSSQPSWWTTVPYPATGPDVTGGSGPGGHSYGNPAYFCYLTTMHGTDGGVGSPLTFDPTACYGAAAPIVSFSPTSVAFGNITTGTSSSPQTITLSNIGSATLNISSISLQTGTQYAISSQTCGSSLAASNSCTFNVTFSPTTSGAKADNVLFSGNASGGPVPLSGTGIATAPVASFSPTSVAFGNQNVGSSSAPQTITLTNTGNASLTISSISLQTGTQYAISSQTCGSTLAISASCTFNVTFTPTSGSLKSDNVVFSGNVAGGPVPLSGTGINVPAAPVNLQITVIE